MMSLEDYRDSTINKNYIEWEEFPNYYGLNGEVFNKKTGYNLKSGINCNSYTLKNKNKKNVSATHFSLFVKEPDLTGFKQVISPLHDNIDSYFVNKQGILYSTISKKFTAGAKNKSKNRYFFELSDIFGNRVKISRAITVKYTFDPIPDYDKFEVNHIDNDCTNDNLANLEWIEIHKHRKLKKPHTKDTRMFKFQNIKTLEFFEGTIHDLGELISVTEKKDLNRTIRNLRNLANKVKRKTAYNFIIVHQIKNPETIDSDFKQIEETIENLTTQLNYLNTIKDEEVELKLQIIENKIKQLISL